MGISIEDIKKEFAGVYPTAQDIFAIIVTGALGFVGEIYPTFKAYTDEAVQQSYKMHPIVPAPIDVQVESVLRKIQNEATFIDIASRFGLNETEAKKYLAVNKRLLDVDTLIRSLAFKEISEDEYFERMAKLGFEKDDAEKIRKISIAVPSATDLISFAVREVFTEDVASKYGYDEGLDEVWSNLESWAKKVFLDKDTFKLYWRSHWALPSPLMGYEMYQRGLIDYSTLDQLLKVLDYPSFWRDKLIKLNYNVLNRVDVRRLYQVGLMSKDEVKEAYIKMGYSPEDADKLTEFTVKNYGLKERDLTKSEIEKGVKEGLISRETAINYLLAYGYTEDEADYIITLWTYQKQKDILNTKVETIKTNYVNGTYSKSDVIIRLNELNLPSDMIDSLMSKFDAEKIKNLKMPTKEDVLRWREKEFIDDETALNLLVLIGYPEVIAKMYLLEQSIAKTEKS